MKKTLSFRLSIRFMILVAAIVLLIASLFVFALRLSIRNKQSRTLYENAVLLAQELKSSEEEIIDIVPVDYFVSYMIFDKNTNETFFTNDPLLPKLELTQGKAKKYFKKDFYTDGDLNILYCSITADPCTIVQTSIDIDQDASIEMINSLPLVAALALFPILLISFLISLIISKQTLKPVEEITKTARGISSTNLETLLPVSKNDDELDSLAKTFNQLFVNLKKDFEREVNFTSDVSHELKTPVAGILGQANLLKRWGKDDPKQLEESLELIINEAKSMESIINNLLQVSKLENGIIKPVSESMNLWSMFSRLQNEFNIIAPDVKITFNENMDLELQSDMELLHQVLTAIISNSIKYGGTTVELSATKLSDNCQITVIDNGPGFAEEVLPHVFERFYRGDKSHNRSAGGAGLGLSISYTIVKALEGTITARNCKDHSGAELIISLYEKEI